MKNKGSEYFRNALYTFKSGHTCFSLSLFKRYVFLNELDLRLFCLLFLVNILLHFSPANQPSQKVCVPAYLSHAPVSGLPNSVLTSDSATGKISRSSLLSCSSFSFTVVKIT